MQTCKLCGETKPLEGFYAKDKVCSECRKARERARGAVRRAAAGKALGETFTAINNGRKVCSRCRVELPLEQFPIHRGAPYSQCFACKNQGQRESYEQNRESRLARNCKYAQAHKTTLLAYGRRYHATNRAQLNEGARLRYLADRANRIAKVKAYGDARPEWRREGARRRSISYHKRHPDRALDQVMRRRARLKNAPRVEKINRAAIIARDNSTCYLCGKILQSGFNLTLDHKIPLARGGTHTADNLAVACRSCNCKKYTHLLVE